MVRERIQINTSKADFISSGLQRRRQTGHGSSEKEPLMPTIPWPRDYNALDWEGSSFNWLKKRLVHNNKVFLRYSQIWKFGELCPIF